MPPWYTHGFWTEVFLSYSQLIKALHTSLSTNQTFPFVSDNSRTFVYSSKNLTAFEHLKGLVTYRRKSWTFSIYSYIGYLHDSWVINRWRGDNAFHLPQVFHTFHIHPHFSTDTSLQCQIMNCIGMCWETLLLLWEILFGWLGVALVEEEQGVGDSDSWVVVTWFYKNSLLAPCRLLGI